MNTTETTSTVRSRWYKSPFSVFDETAYCPHCGSHFGRDELRVAGEIPTPGEKRHEVAVVCPVCHARGFLLAGKPGGDA